MPIPSAALLLSLLLPLLGPAVDRRGPQASAPATVVSGEEGARFDDWLGRLERLGFSGAALVARGDEVVLAKGYGAADRAAGVPMTPRSVVSLGSITKQFTAALILRLEMDGALSVDDPITSFFDDVPADKAEITVHHLLCHHGGFAEALGSIAGVKERDAFVREALASELAAPPGREFVYSNVGYGLLAAIAEVVTLTPYEECLRELVLAPAGMESTGFAVASWTPDQLAHGYIDDRDTGPLEDGGGETGWLTRGSGGLHTTILDMQRWYRSLATRSVLSEDALARMTTPYGVPYGYGCGVGTTARGTKRIGHSGSNDIFSADFQYFPSEDVFVYVCGNNADFYATPVAHGLCDMAFGASPVEPPRIVALGDEVVERYAGSWELETGGRIASVAREGALVLSSGDPDAAALLHPVEPGQTARRARLMGEAREAFRRAAKGDFAAAHALLDPFVPARAFAEMLGRRLEALRSELGPLSDVRCVPGRNRFGEIAIIVVLVCERGEQMIEYSFGEREVGSIRFLRELPNRVVRPEARERFVAFDLETGRSFVARFALDDGGGPIALVLVDEAGREHEAARTD